jgi:putative transposase
MKTIMRGYRLELKLTEEQRKLCARSAGTARYAYNWKLDKLIREYESLVALKTMYDLPKVPNIMGSPISWHRDWVLLKNEKPWIRETSKCCGQEALRNLGTAFQNFFKNPKKMGYPKFKKRGDGDSFRLTGSTYVGKDFVHIPGIGKVKLYEKGRVPIPQGQEEVDLKQLTIVRQADRWFASFLLEDQIADPAFAKLEDITVDPYDVVGVDLGIKDLAITSYGETFDNPKALKSNLKRLKRYQRMVSRRRKKGSKNGKKAISKVSSLHKRVADIRTDAAHKMTTQVVKTKPKVLVIEGLKPKNMAKNRKLAGSIADAAWGKIRTQFTYKSEWAGCHLVVAPQFYASSKLCSVCGYYKEDLKLSERTWLCPHCGEHHDRDVNAAVNLRAYGLWLLDLPQDEIRTVSFTGLACDIGESGVVVQVSKAPVHRDRRLQFFTERCLSLKQEFSTYLGTLRCA